MNTHEQRAAIGAASAAIAVAGIFAVVALDSATQLQKLALALFSLSLPAHLLFSLVQFNMAVEANLRNPAVVSVAFWFGQSTLFVAIAVLVASASSAAAACFVVSVLASLMGYGYAAKTDGRKA